MPGIATRFEILRLVIAELKKPAAGPDLNAIAGILEAHPPYAHLGVIGPVLADFLPSAPPAPGDDFPATFAGVWQTLFSFLGGQAGLFATLKNLRTALDELDAIIFAESEDALLALRDSGRADQIKETADTFKALIGGLKDTADRITDTIAKGLKPNVCTEKPGDPVPPPSQWRARDVLHWKKTGRFAQALLKHAQSRGKPEFQAYAYGWAVGYVAATCGAPFINSSVGGPARTQWWRQRFVKNYVDAWVYGFYKTHATMSGDDPTPPYADWPDLCESSLHKAIELAPLDAADLMQRIKRHQAFPTGVLPGDFGTYWIDAFTSVYGAPASGTGINAEGLNGAFIMTWLMLWFMTSGEVLDCKLKPPAGPPDGCGDAPQELDPFKTDPETHAPIQPPLPDVAGAVDPNEAGVVCGWILAILGAMATLFGAGVAGALTLLGGLALIDDEFDVDWKSLRCQMYWLRMYIHLGLKGLHQLLAISGFGYPHGSELKDDTTALNLAEVPYTWATGKFLVKSQVSDQNFPSKPWSGSKLGFNQPPNAISTGYETPRATAYRIAAYPDFFVNDDVNNPLSKGDVKTKGTAFPFRPDSAGGPSEIPVQFGNAVANSIDLLKTLSRIPPDWNLDGDRGLAALTWQFDQFYDPDNVKIKPES